MHNQYHPDPSPSLPSRLTRSDSNPLNQPMQRPRSVFTFDTPSLTSGFGLTPTPPNPTGLMPFTQEGDRPPFSLMERSLYPLNQPSSIDPYYTPDFHNQSLSGSFHQQDNYSSFRSRSLFSELPPLHNNPPSSLLSQPQQPLSGLPLLPSDYYPQDDLLSHRPFSISTSPSFACSPTRSDPPHAGCQAPSPTRPPPPPRPSHNEPTHASPSRPKRSTRSRGGSPGTPEPINELKIDDVRSGKDTRTTLMIKNIPNAWSHHVGVRRRFSRETVLGIINKSCKDKYDFFYLPIDQKTGCNLGYGYINMIDRASVVTLYEEVGIDVGDDV